MTEHCDRPRIARANVIVVMYNSESTLPALFDGMVANRVGIASVTLVDNASADESAETARKLLAESGLRGRVLRAANTGFAGGHWEARDSFDDPTLPTLCLNPDVQLDADALLDMIEVLQGLGEEAGIVTSTLVSTEGIEDSASRRRLPTVTTGALYSILGKLVPSKFRYNQIESTAGGELVAGHAITRVEATTGALMLVAPQLQNVEEGIFDRDYFMYGEDLQLCLRAQRSNRAVAIVERRPSIHVKGVSSGFPRSWKSNRAFHDAMYIYYRKNLSISPIDRALVWSAVWARLLISSSVAATARARAKRAR
jgi:N-acetylglucosaminyl-diphospho-decaprenol L-rhamnosyltransferase